MDNVQTTTQVNTQAVPLYAGTFLSMENFKQQPQIDSKYTFQKITEDFIYYSQFGRGEPVSAQTLVSYHRDANRLNRLWGSKDIRQLDIMDIMQLKQAMIGRNCSKGYIQKTLCFIRSVLRYCKTILELQVMEPDRIELPAKERKPIKFLTLDELKLFLGAIDVSKQMELRFMALIMVLLTSLMRISECMSLDRTGTRSIDRTGRVPKARIIGKGGKERVVFFTPWALAWLDAYLSTRTDTNPAVFLNQYGGRWDRENARRMFKIIALRAGIDPKKATNHITRKTGATLLKFNGTDIRDIQQMLGHSSVTITEKFYVGLDDEKLQDAYQSHMHFNGLEDSFICKEVKIAWAKFDGWEKCQECGTTERRHAGHGYCDLCYIRALRAGKIEAKKKTSGENIVQCD